LALSSLLNSASTEDLTRRQDATDVLLSKQTRAYDTLRATQVLAEVGETRVEEGALEVATRQQAAAASLQDLQEARGRARFAAQEVRKSVLQGRRARQRAQRIRARDLAVLRRAEAAEARIRERIRDAARRQAAQAARDNSNRSSVATADGFLMPPVAGSVSSPFGYRVHPIFKYWGLHDGIDYAAGCGQPLWAGAAGVVTSKYYSDVYGYRLFVDVGAASGMGITLVYNHAAGYSVDVGDRLRRGQVIGSVGNSGWSTGCHLHFTVLANGNPVDPGDWY
jgi:murein DD-endopeptidase MepM/ murein hydrolase activator NlpD